MALIKCTECESEISKKAKECPNCGAPLKKKTSLITWAFTLIIGFVIISVIVNSEDGDGAPATVTAPTTYPTNNASYEVVNSEVGCESKYSDDKKDDIFKSKFKDNWFTWTGTVLLVEADNVSLNIDNFGTQDVMVKFSDKNAGYDLVKDSTITVTFLMDKAGGCFLPFRGKQASVNS
jgi:hypothetical protein